MKGSVQCRQISFPSYLKPRKNISRKNEKVSENKAALEKKEERKASSVLEP